VRVGVGAFVDDGRAVVVADGVGAVVVGRGVVETAVVAGVGDVRGCVVGRVVVTRPTVVPEAADVAVATLPDDDVPVDGESTAPEPRCTAAPPAVGVTAPNASPTAAGVGDAAPERSTGVGEHAVSTTEPASAAPTVQRAVRAIAVRLSCAAIMRESSHMSRTGKRVRMLAAVSCRPCA
jgi:hypothetical protein